MTDEKLLQKHPGYRIYSPVIAQDCDRPYPDMEACPEGRWVPVADYDALAARLAEAERLVVEWRKQYKYLGPASDEGPTFRDCANDLEAALHGTADSATAAQPE